MSCAQQLSSRDQEKAPFSAGQSLTPGTYTNLMHEDKCTRVDVLMLVLLPGVAVAVPVYVKSEYLLVEQKRRIKKKHT